MIYLRTPRLNLISYRYKLHKVFASVIRIYIKFDYVIKSEFHPFWQQRDIVELCRTNSIVFQAYSSLGTSDRNLNQKLLDNPVVCSIADKYSKKSAQILLKWALQQNIGIKYKTFYEFFLRGIYIHVIKFIYI